MTKLIASVRSQGSGFGRRTSLWINGQCVEGLTSLAARPGIFRKFRLEVELEVDDVVVFVDGRLKHLSPTEEEIHRA